MKAAKGAAEAATIARESDQALNIINKTDHAINDIRETDAEGETAFRTAGRADGDGEPVSVKEVKMGLGRAKMSVSDYDIEHVPEIEGVGGEPAYGASPRNFDGTPKLGSRGRPLIQLSDLGLRNMNEAVHTIFHEVYHHEMYRAFGHGGTEAAAEQYCARMLDKFLRRAV
jgi:hypothetical protein